MKDAQTDNVASSYGRRRGRHPATDGISQSAGQVGAAAKVIAAMLEEPGLTAGEARLRAGYKSVGMGPMWVKRFNEEGLKELDDRPCCGRRPTHPPEVRSALSRLALQKPRSLGYPFESSCGRENSSHWRLDIAFREDQSRVRLGYAAENLAVIRHMALNLLKSDWTKKLGVKSKHLLAGWDENYLLHLIAGNFKT